MKQFWRKFKDLLIKLAIKGLAKIDMAKAKAKLLEILKSLEEKK